MSEEKKLFRIEWTEAPLFAGDEVFTYVEFRTATSWQELIQDWSGTDIKIREATVEETEGYVAGYEDGYDVATVKYKLEQLDLSESEPLNWDRLKSKFDSDEETN
jgi:hypothetical protein